MAIQYTSPQIGSEERPITALSPFFRQRFAPATKNEAPVNSPRNLVENDPNLTDYLTVCESAARMAARELDEWRGKFKVRSKAPSDLVTEADEAAQRIISDYLQSELPDHSFLGEESPDTATNNISAAEYIWIVDPLDGTTNYVHGFPYYCVSIALASKGKLLVGTVYNPTTDDCFSAAAGNGATLNGEPIHVSETSRMSEALLAASFPAEVDRDSVEVARFLKMLDASRSIRRLGAAALNLANVAAGRIDGYWGSTAKAWDVAAGLLLIQEAGGVVTNLNGGEFHIDDPHFIVAATPALHNEILPLLS